MQPTEPNNGHQNYNELLQNVMSYLPLHLQFTFSLETEKMPLEEIKTS